MRTLSIALVVLIIASAGSLEAQRADSSATRANPPAVRAVRAGPAVTPPRVTRRAKAAAAQTARQAPPPPVVRKAPKAAQPTR